VPGTRELDPTTDQEQRVTPLELFFDLVFVLSFTQVTAAMAEDPSWQGLGEGMLVLAAVWWAWAAYGWLTNAIDADETINRLCMFSAMGAMLIVSLAIPQAFGDEALLFACAYAYVRVMQLVLYARNTRMEGDEDNLGAILGLTPGFLFTSALFIAGGAVGGVAQVVIWALAVVLDFATPALFGTEGFHLHPAHFAERHGLIVIIALGESIVAIGAGAGFELKSGEVVAAVLGIGAVAALWWAYFDIVAIVAERRLSEAPFGEQGPLARDSFSYIHYPMIAGIVLFALGLKKAEAGVDDPL
jgi:low temperature requirement protein LtrA